MRMSSPRESSREYVIPLADAYQHGITHRDLKPGNVMIGHDGRVKVRSRVWIVDAAGEEPRCAGEDVGQQEVGPVRLTAGSSTHPRVAAISVSGSWTPMAACSRRPTKAHDSWPAVTTDGRRVVFVSERGGVVLAAERD